MRIPVRDPEYIANAPKEVSTLANSLGYHLALKGCDCLYADDLIDIARTLIEMGVSFNTGRAME